MDSTLKKQLQEWAKEYNQPKYFQEDPCQFPHRFKKKQDIEISGFLAFVWEKGTDCGQMRNHAPTDRKQSI